MYENATDKISSEKPEFYGKSIVEELQDINDEANALLNKIIDSRIIQT